MAVTISYFNRLFSWPLVGNIEVFRFEREKLAMKSWFKRLVGNTSCEVHFEDGPTVAVNSGTTIMDASKQAKVDIDSFCGENLSCSTCKVIIVDGAKCLSKASAEEQALLGQAMVKKNYRLSCQAKIDGVVHVKVPEYF